MNDREREPWAIRLSAQRRLAIVVAVSIAVYSIGPTVVSIANRLHVTWIAASLTYLILYWLTILRSGRVRHLPACNDRCVRKYRRHRLRDG